MNKERCLFIGGPADGTWREVYKGQERVDVMEIPMHGMLLTSPGTLANTETIHSHTYRAERVRSQQGTDTLVYVLDGIDPLAVLIKGYRNTAPL